MDITYDAIDCCSNSQKIAFDCRDTELEARIEAFMGRILYQGLKKLKRAKTHLANAIRLEATLRPRNCCNEQWYKTSKE